MDDEKSTISYSNYIEAIKHLRMIKNKEKQFIGYTFSNAYDMAIVALEEKYKNLRMMDMGEEFKEEFNIVSVRWNDGYLEEFSCKEVRFGSDLLWMRLSNGSNRHIPLRQVRWFGMTKESHSIIS